MEVTITTLILTLLIAVSVVKLLLLTKNRIETWGKFRNFPQTPETPYPLIGHALYFRGDPVQTYSRMLRVVKGFADKGHEFGIIWMGPSPVGLITGANAAEVVLRSSQHTTKGFFYDFLHPWLGTGLLTSKGNKWKARRRLLTPTFHFNILQDFLEVMNEQANAFLSKLEPHAKSGKVFNIFKPVTLCALDIICETAMGKSVHALDDEDSEYVTAVYRTSELIQDRQRSPWLWWDIVYYLTKRGQEFAKHLGVLHSFSEKIIFDRMRMSKLNNNSSPTKKRRLAFLDMLISASEDGTVLSFSDIREEVDTFMFEGHDTTATAMSWAFHLIGSHPDVQRRIQNEIDTVLGSNPDRVLSMDDLRKLEYLEMVIKESLRLYPSVPMFGRTTTTDCIIEGQLVPVGTDVVVFTQMLNENPKNWDNPHKFDPERFTMANSDGRHPYSYVPFSAGPRNCIGQRFALMEEKTILAKFFGKYSIESCQKTDDIELMADLILRPCEGIKVKISKRAEIASF